MKKLTGANLSELQYYNISKAIADAAQADTQPLLIHQNIYWLILLLNTYITAYPDKPQPYSFRVRYAKYSDKDTTKGLAIPAIAQQNQYEMKFKDTSATAKQIIFRNDVYLLYIMRSMIRQGEKAANYQKAIDYS